MAIASTECNYGSRHSVLELKTHYPALFVYIQINEVDQYTLSENGFMLVSSPYTVTLDYDDINCNSTLNEKNIKIMTVNNFLI